MKVWCSISVLLVCFVACKNSSLKQREIMSPSVQDTLKDSRYDSILSFADHMPQGIKEAEKSHLHKDSLKGDFFDVLTNDKQRKRLKENQIELLTKKRAPYEESSGDYEECKGWSIPEKTIKYVMKHSKPMNFRELHDMFGVFPCVVEGVLIYKGEPYSYRVNAGGWWELIQGEKYLMMGYYEDDAIKRGFIDGVYDWSKVE
jgi:hypothetical protein